MQNSHSKFFQNSFQFSNFTFVHFNPLSFRFIQLKTFCQLLFKVFENKNLKNILQALIELFELEVFF